MIKGKFYLPFCITISGLLSTEFVIHFCYNRSRSYSSWYTRFVSNSLSHYNKNKSYTHWLTVNLNLSTAKFMYMRSSTEQGKKHLLYYEDSKHRKFWMLLVPCGLTLVNHMPKKEEMAPQESRCAEMSRVEMQDFLAIQPNFCVRRFHHRIKEA